MSNLTKTVIAIKIVLGILFFIALADLPYGYYIFLRFIAMISFAILAYEAGTKEQSKVVILYIVLAVLFQPFFPLPLGRVLWNILDVIIGIGLLLSLIPTIKSSKK